VHLHANGVSPSLKASHAILAFEAAGFFTLSHTCVGYPVRPRLQHLLFQGVLVGLRACGLRTYPQLPVSVTLGREACVPCLLLQAPVLDLPVLPAQLQLHSAWTAACISSGPRPGGDCLACRALLALSGPRACHKCSLCHCCRHQH
jgi:hypothetical protein